MSFGHPCRLVSGKVQINDNDLNLSPVSQVPAPAVCCSISCVVAESEICAMPSDRADSDATQPDRDESGLAQEPPSHPVRSSYVLCKAESGIAQRAPSNQVHVDSDASGGISGQYCLGGGALLIPWNR